MHAHNKGFFLVRFFWMNKLCNGNFFGEYMIKMQKKKNVNLGIKLFYQEKNIIIKKIQEN